MSSFFDKRGHLLILCVIVLIAIFCFIVLIDQNTDGYSKDKCIQTDVYDKFKQEIDNLKKKSGDKISEHVKQKYAELLNTIPKCEEIETPTVPEIERTNYSGYLGVQYGRLVDNQHNNFVISCNPGFYLRINDNGVKDYTPKTDDTATINCAVTKPNAEAITKLQNLKELNVLYKTSQGCETSPENC